MLKQTLDKFFDITGEDGNYGRQRVWGTLGWGLMGPLGGFLVDQYSGDNFQKNYLPAFTLLFILGACDVMLTATKLKVSFFFYLKFFFKSFLVITCKKNGTRLLHNINVY